MYKDNIKMCGKKKELKETFFSVGIFSSHHKKKKKKNTSTNTDLDPATGFY